MNIIRHAPGLRRTAIALALLGAFSPLYAAADDMAQFTKPESSASIGVAAVSGDSKDRAIFGQYNGMREHNVVGLLDLDYVKRDDATGTWVIVKAQNLGLDSRELSVVHEKQGNWKTTASYSELERDYPRTINTAMVGAGTTTPTVVRLNTPGTGTDVDLKTQRKAANLGFEKWIGTALQLEVNFKDEEKNGARLWGRGYDCAAYVCGGSTSTAISQAAFVKNALLLLPEPINSSTKQIDAKANFHTDKLLISAGYYGSFYNNAYGSLNPTVPNLFNNGLGAPFPGYPAVGGNIIAGGGTSLQNVLQSPLALPPDNQAHQFYLDGNYSVSAKTKANFKYAYTYATQNDNFAGMGLSDAPAGMDSLRAKVVSSLAQVGFSTRPADRLSVVGNVRYEHKNDKTPTALYNVEPASVVPATVPGSFTNVGKFWDNNKTTSTRLASKLEASYRFANDFRGTLGMDYSTLEREVPHSLDEEKVAGLGALRAKNAETTYRVELRRSLSDTLNGAVSYSQSQRTGSNWTTLSTLDPATPGISAANLALIGMYCGGVACYGQQLPASSIIGMSATTPFPLSQTDIQRNKWKLSADWNPTERLSLQLVLEDGHDQNRAPIDPVAGGKGWRDSLVALYSLDAAYAISDNWKLSAYASHSDQTQHVNHSTGYMADLNNLNDAAGLSITGKVNAQLEVGATLSYLNDINKYGLGANTGTAGTLPGPLTVVAPSAANLAQAAIGLPDAAFRQRGLKLFGKYALKKTADLRFELGHQRVKFSEWQWSNNGVPFVYADNSTVSMQQNQNVSYVGLTYLCKF
jgi:MtrB/PioB family decaheme-associated outer membrane protein